ncbi:pseudouridine synthase [Aestuariimicrobium sp. Y1814]|uniref:pseudouridine synthase n=1 Tax=Aestuariimicrobium sp. Y1814 TaxID=3418742 RepID=UPI003DA79CC5
MGAYLRERFPKLGLEGLERMLVRGDFVDQQGRRLTGEEPYTPHTFVWFHRELRDEPEVPGEIEVLFRDERIVVVDKPHFLTTIPRGRHIRQSVVVRMREQLDLPELGPAHRLDRQTAGVLVLTTEQRWRGAYQDLFAQRLVTKTYTAVARFDPDLALPRVVESHIHKQRGVMQAVELPDREPNARTLVELDEVGPLDAEGRRWARYRLSPHTGRTHQLRLHLNSLGIPIRHDPLYPVDLDRDLDDFTDPLQLLAHRLEFDDPVDGSPRRYESRRVLQLP